MKKLFLGFAALSLLFGAASCAKETRESVTDGDGNVAFRAALGKQSRVGEFTIDSWNSGDKMDVYAYANGYTTLVNKFELELTGTDWGYSPVFHQPGYALRYYAVYPSDATGLKIDGTGIDGTTTLGPSTSSYSFDYTVQDVADQVDLIAASVAATIDEEVTLPFSHVLSQVNFAVVDIVSVKIEINDISVNSVKNAGTYTFGATNPWTYAGTPTTDTYAYDSGTFTADGTTGGILYMGNGGGATGDYTKTNALMLMPQAFAAQADGTFSFDYSVTVDKNGNTDFSDETPKTGSAIVNFSDFDKKTWAPGKRYVYVIDFTSYLAGGPITFKVTVDDWVDADATDENGYIAQTIHVANPSKQSVEAAIALHHTANVANDALKVFPISIPETFVADAIEITKIYGFDKDDIISIECESDAVATILAADITVAGWSTAISTGSNRVVELKCTIPTIKGASATVDLTNVTDDAELITAIEAAITALNATGTVDSVTEYTVTVGEDFTSAAAIAPAGNYVTGDIIRLVFPSNSNNVTATGWTAATVGNEVLLTK